MQSLKSENFSGFGLNVNRQDKYHSDGSRYWRIANKSMLTPQRSTCESRTLKQSAKKDGIQLSSPNKKAAEAAFPKPLILTKIRQPQLPKKKVKHR